MVRGGSSSSARPADAAGSLGGSRLLNAYGMHSRAHRSVGLHVGEHVAAAHLCAVADYWNDRVGRGEPSGGRYWLAADPDDVRPGPLAPEFRARPRGLAAPADERILRNLEGDAKLRRPARRSFLAPPGRRPLRRAR